MAAGGVSLDQVQMGMDAAFGTWVDTNSRFTTPPVATPGAGGGIAMSLTGGWNVTDPFDGPHVIGPAMAMDTALAWCGQMSVIERAIADITVSDIFVGCGVCNEAADSGTIDAVFWGILYGTTTRTPRKGTVANGAVTVNNGTAAATIRIFQNFALRFGDDAAARWQVPQGRALDAAGDVITAAALGNTDHGVAGGVANPRPFLFVHRITNTDLVTRTLTTDFTRSAFTGVRLTL